MPDVTIPADVAVKLAAWLRTDNCGGQPYLSEWADLLDPRPASLREQVLHALDGLSFGPDDDNPWGLLHADAVLAVVADWLAAQPLMDPDETGRIAMTRPLNRQDQRDADVALIRGGAAKDDPRCSAHGMTLAQHEADLSEPDCNYQSDRCQCGSYAETGMHWDTCPGRGRFARGGAS